MAFYNYLQGTDLRDIKAVIRLLRTANEIAECKFLHVFVRPRGSGVG